MTKSYRPSPAPFEVLDAAAEELGLPEIQRDLAADRAAFQKIEHIAADRCHRDALTKQALDTCGLLHASAQSRREEGYLPEDTINEAVTKGADVHRQRGHAARLAGRRAGEMVR